MDEIEKEIERRSTLWVVYTAADAHYHLANGRIVFSVFSNALFDDEENEFALQE